eukprot:SAG22_NODE_15047_length_358_cov_1.162162_1_plen_30_part_10
MIWHHGTGARAGPKRVLEVGEVGEPGWRTT